MTTKDASPLRRNYYSVRSGKRASAQGFSLADFKRFFSAAFDRMEEQGLFQEWFGYTCIDAGEILGRAGPDLELFVFRKLRRQDLWPLREKLGAYSEDDLFDVVEFLFDHASEGVDGTHHTYNDCGWHYTTFNASAGRESFRSQVNELLIDYASGFELSPAGEILTLANDDFAPLLVAHVPHEDKRNVTERVAAAKLKYRRRSLSERKDAVRDLADVLEYLRPEVKKALKSKDESELFQLANNFGIRHHNKDQKTDYDESIWLSWMFYHYLANIHACLRLVEKGKGTL